MAANAKTVRILMLVLALCGGIFGAFVAVKVSHRLQLSATLQIGLVSLGAVCGCGTVWLFYWMAKNLFVEVPEENSGPTRQK